MGISLVALSFHPRTKKVHYFSRLALIVLLSLSNGISGPHAAVIGTSDRRVFLTRLAHDVGLSDTEVEHLRNSLGIVSCKNNNTLIVGAASVIEPGDRIITSAHIFLDKDWSLIKTIRECNFFPFNSAFGVRYFDFDTPQSRFGTTGTSLVDNRYDWAVIKLLKPLAEGLKLASSFDSRKDEELVNLIPLLPKEGKSPTFESQPYAQKCSAQIVEETSIKNGGLRLATDCSSQSGQSGSPLLVRQNGEWKLIGILSSEIGDHSDFKPFDPNQNATTFVGLWKLNVETDGHALP